MPIRREIPQRTMSISTGAGARRALFLLIVIAILAGALALTAPPAAHAVTPTPTDPVQRSDFYGINFISPYPPWLTIGQASGAGVVRWQFNWRDHETSPGSWDWVRADTAIRSWNEAGLLVHAILHNPPDFALANPGGLMPVNLDFTWDNPATSFSRFCYVFALRYRGQIASYEVWNEPDLGQFWGGTPQQYYTLLRGCYQGIKAADPTVQVAMAGMAYNDGGDFFGQVLDAAVADPSAPLNNYYFDAAAIHMYADPELVYSRTMEIRELLADHGMGGRPVWITETNVPLRGVNGVSDTPHRGLATPEEAGWYVLQAASNAYAGGASRLMFFRLADDGMSEAWGLANADGSPRPAYQALQLATAVLHDVVEAHREVVDGVVITTLRRSDGGRIVTAYSQDGTAAVVSVRAESPAAVLINAAGGYSTITPGSSGSYTITLPPASGRDFNRPFLYTVGGPVLIIVEFDRDPPTASVEIVPLPFDQEHVLVRWRGSDGRFGTGVASYDVELSVDGGPWVAWQTGVTATEEIYDISAGGAFAFRARATDQKGNVGAFSDPVQTTFRLVGTLVAQVVDLRGQAVPHARVTLADGSLHDADETGWVRIELPPGTARILHVDGAGQGQLSPGTVEIELREETVVAWTLLPRQNIIANGSFETGLRGWAVSSPADAGRAISADSAQAAVLRIVGSARPWGAPAASLSLRVPPGMASAVLNFHYRLAAGGQSLRVRVVRGDEQFLLWQTGASAESFTRAWVDVSRFAGDEVTIYFELWGEKGAPPGIAEIDGVVLGDVPVLP